MRGVVPNKVLLLTESQNIWLQKNFQAGYTTAYRPVLKITLA